MGFKTDIEIAQECTMAPITEIAKKAGIDEKYLEQYGKYKAKIDYNLLKESDKKDGKLVLVTAINPTPAGEGKTTTTVGLADGLQKLGKNVMVAPMQAAAMARWFPWRISTFISPAISMLSARPTTCWRP